MLSKISASKEKILLLVSFLLSAFGLTFFNFLRLPFISGNLTVDAQKSTVFSILVLLSVVCFTLYTYFSKSISFPKSKWFKIFFFANVIILILSTLFSPNMSNSIFGKYTSIQSFTSLFSLLFSFYILLINIKKYKRVIWYMLAASSFLVTVPVIVGLIFSKIGWVTLANKLVYFVDNWDIVAVASGIVLILTLMYFEKIAYTKLQKILSLVIIFVHLLLILCIVLPDIWYGLSIASLSVLLISLLQKKESFTKIFRSASFYVFVVSIIFSFLFTANFSWSQKIATSISNFSVKYSSISYSFVKPRFGLSVNLVSSELMKGHIFGGGIGEFYNIWQKDKPQTVINSAYWNTDFTSSYSALTTFGTTLGIFSIITLLGIIGFVFYSLFKKLLSKGGELKKLDEENQFYILGGTALFAFASTLLIVFANINIALILFLISLALVIQNNTLKDYKLNKIVYGIIFVVFIIILCGSIININRARSSNIYYRAMVSYQKNGDLNKLEKSLISAARISNDDSYYRTLSQFYLYKAQSSINQSSTSTQVLQNDVLAAINNAIVSDQKAIKIDSNDYNNYLSLGSVYGFLMGIDKQNRDIDYQNAKLNYEKALSLYPKNPSIPLSLAQLEYSYNQNSTTTLQNIQNSLNIKPNYTSAYFILSQLSAQNNDRTDALKYAALAIQSDPQNLQAYLQYGILYLNKPNPTMDDLNQAYTAFVYALNIDSSNTTAAYYLATTYILAKDYDKAQSIIDSIKTMMPNNQNVNDLQTFLNQRKGGSANVVSTNASTTKATTTKTTSPDKKK